MLQNPQLGQIVFAIEENRNNWFEKDYSQLYYEGVICRICQGNEGYYVKENIKDKFTKEELEIGLLDPSIDTSETFDKISTLVKEFVSPIYSVEIIHKTINKDDDGKEYIYLDCNPFKGRDMGLLFETEEEAKQYLKEQFEILKENVNKLC